MNKGELVDAIASKASISKKTADATLTSVLEAIVEAVASGNKLSLVGFGSFAPRERQAREGCNPKTGKTMQQHFQQESSSKKKSPHPRNQRSPSQSERQGLTLTPTILREVSMQRILAVVVDTNVFIAAAFNRSSHSAYIIEALRQGQLRLCWNDQTCQETEHLLQKIPRLSWDDFSGLFRQEDRYPGQTDPEQFGFVPDWEDRKFAALAKAAKAILITKDQDLLSVRSLTHVSILTPSEFVEQALD